MSKNLNIGMLLDFYGQLLTDKQADAVDFYYNQDFSLSEIADSMSISRQGVRDLIKRGEKQLLELEEALGLVSRFSGISAELSGITALCDQIKSRECDKKTLEDTEKIAELVKKITDKI